MYHLQCVGKSKTHLIYECNHRKDSKTKISTSTCQHFKASNYNFQRDAKITLIEEITKPATKPVTTYSQKNEKSLDTQDKITSSRQS